MTQCLPSFSCNTFIPVKAEKIKELESKSVEEWIGLCMEKRCRSQDLPEKPSKKQKQMRVSKQVAQNLPPSMQHNFIPELGSCLPDIDWG